MFDFLSFSWLGFRYLDHAADDVTGTASLLVSKLPPPQLLRGKDDTAFDDRAGGRGGVGANRHASQGDEDERQGGHARRSPQRTSFFAASEGWNEQDQQHKQGGRSAAPTHSSWPGKNFSISKSAMKYHSGRGMYVVSVGSARSSSGTPESTVRATGATKTKRG